MSWTRAPLPCTLNGIRVIVDSAEDTFTEGLVEHTYPDRNGADLEPVGSEARRLALTAFVTGPLWLEDLETLIASIQFPGAHTLVHPQFGTMTGRVRVLTITHRDEEHDLARLRIEFVEGRLIDGLSFANAATLASAAASVRTSCAAITAATAALES